MKHGLIWRIILSLCVLVASVVLVLPTLLPALETEEAPSGLRRFLPRNRINLGLDLKGGMYLTLGVDVDKAIERILMKEGQELMTTANSKGLLITRPVLVPGEKLEFSLAAADKMTDFEALVRDEFKSLRIDSSLPAAGNRRAYTVGLISSVRDEQGSLIVDQAVATIRNRIDQFGVAEPDVRRQQNSERIVIQLPGMTDPERAVAIIGKTAHLEFHIVRDDVDPSTATPPRGVRILPMEAKSREGRAIEEPVAVDEQAVLTGEHIQDARLGYDPNNNAPLVSLSFDREGARIFSQLTEENVGRRMAIVLDNRVHSAPVINEKISGGKASITGRFTSAEANDLAVVLRAGSLPAPVVVLEERTVGPSLGQQSIDMGVKAALIGGAAVIVFMAAYYGLSGMIANLMVLFDIVLILAGLAVFGATLTMPGIAGIVLTLGMAVDANVLIFERIREEMRRGLTPAAAIEAGFSRAMLAITDSNLTTIIAAVILYQFGTGPVRGFAVTLTIGILASMFTAIFVSRVIFDLWMGKPGRKLSI